MRTDKTVKPYALGLPRQEEREHYKLQLICKQKGRCQFLEKIFLELPSILCGELGFWKNYTEKGRCN